MANIVDKAPAIVHVPRSKLLNSGRVRNFSKTVAVFKRSLSSSRRLADSAFSKNAMISGAGRARNDYAKAVDTMTV
jgi:hypothetical protein